MGKLILTSGGYLDGQRGPECDAIIEKYSRGKKILIADNATLTGSNTKGIPVLVNNFAKIGNDVEVLSLNKDNLHRIFEFDVVYITGGDCTPLIELANNTDAKNVFKTYLQSGKTVIGESAGSIIFGKDLKFYYDIKKGTKPKYDVELPTYKGFGFVDINFYPHWNKASDETKLKVADYEQNNNIKITGVEDNRFIVFDVKEKFEIEVM